MNFKDIHIGSLIKERVDELGIDQIRLNNFLQLSDQELEHIYKQNTLDTGLLLRCSKILDYDFFRIYTQHLIFYSPPAKLSDSSSKTVLPKFRKNIYTQEIIDFILQQIKTNKKTKAQIITDYKIPKTTLYKWLKKYS